MAGDPYKEIKDIIIVGAGPGGSSAAAFLAGQGFSVLLLDKDRFPRDKVCGDALTPKALYWLEVLGCADSVLERTKSCLTQGSVFINDEHVLTSTFPRNTGYPWFSILLKRKDLDHILVHHAVSKGVHFIPDCKAAKLQQESECMSVEAETPEGMRTFRARLVIGADGANSLVSRAIGNQISQGVAAVGIRAYYTNVEADNMPFRVYFDKRFFPGYGWVFVDDKGEANIGIGYTQDRNFNHKIKLNAVFEDFVSTSLQKMLSGARRVSSPKGGIVRFSRPEKLVSHGTMLVGDAGNMADPVNGGGIHMAIESAYFAAQVAGEALRSGDVSADTLGHYELVWRERAGVNRMLGELMLSLSKNPHLKELYLLLLQGISRMIRANPDFEDFCSGLFSGTLPASRVLSLSTLLESLPLSVESWRSVLIDPDKGSVRHLTGQIITALTALASSAGRVVSNPLQNMKWTTEITRSLMELSGTQASRMISREMHEMSVNKGSQEGYS